MLAEIGSSVFRLTNDQTDARDHKAVAHKLQMSGGGPAFADRLLKLVEIRRDIDEFVENLIADIRIEFVNAMALGSQALCDLLKILTLIDQKSYLFKVDFSCGAAKLIQLAEPRDPRPRRLASISRTIDPRRSPGGVVRGDHGEQRSARVPHADDEGLLEPERLVPELRPPTVSMTFKS